MLTLVKHLARAVISPVKPPSKVPFFRGLLLLPVLFDLSSLIVQFLGARFLAAAEQNPANKNEYLDKVQKYNAIVTFSKYYTTTRRAEEFIRWAACELENLKDKKVLLIGPRNVQEFYICWLYGFSKGNVRGIDLYKTSKNIDVMDMHNIKYPDESFDVVICINTLSYASDVKKCVREAMRILRKDGLYVVTHTFTKPSVYAGNYVPGGEVAAEIEASQGSIIRYLRQEKLNALEQKQTVHGFCAVKSQTDLYDRAMVPAATRSPAGQTA